MNTSPFRCRQNGNASTQTSSQHSRRATHSNGPVWWLIGTVPSQCPSYLELVWSGWVKKNIKSMWRATSICSKSHQTWSQTRRTGQQVPDELEACYSVQVPVLFCCPPAVVSLCLGTCESLEPGRAHRPGSARKESPMQPVAICIYST